jgi:sulfate adenylyltransferase subunit 1
LIDARHGVIEQTSRHSFIASLLQIKHVVVCINKMDLVDFSEDRFEEIKKSYTEFASRLDIPDIRFIPISALKGDNVVDQSNNMPWYKGATLMHTLENVKLGADLNHIDARFPVQYVIRPQIDEYRDYRGYAGKVSGGVFKPGDEVVVLPSGFTSKIKSIDTMDGPVAEAFTPMSVTITLETDVDISRGDMIAKPLNMPQSIQDLELMVCWMSTKPLVPGGKYIVKHTTNETRAIVKAVRYKMDINSLHKLEDDLNVGMNDIARINLRTSKPIFADNYKKNRLTGSVILIDEFTNETVAAGMIL